MPLTRLTLSPLAKTWIFDLDGTLVVHNGYKNGGDVLLLGVKEFFDKIPADDFILIVTARKKDVAESTVAFLKSAGIRFDEIIFEVPTGERILINDDKPNGLKTSYAVNLERDAGFSAVDFVIDENL